MNRNLLILFLSFLLLRVSAQDYDLSASHYFDGEPFLAIDPHHSNHIIVAWMGVSVGSLLGIKTKVSFDRGNSWSATTFLPHIEARYHSADPSIVFDTAGYAYACYIDYKEAPDSGGVWIARSPDGGLTWATPKHVIDVFSDGAKMPIDRPWFCINPVNNDFYITTKPPSWVTLPNRPYFSVSKDAGTTWAWRYLDTTAYLTGTLIAAPMATPAVGGDGVVHVVYPSYVTSQNVRPGFLIASSTTDGASFNYHTVGYSSTPANDSLAKQGYHLAVDPTNPNHLVFNFLNKQNGDLDVFITESTNGGNTWTSFARVNDDAVGNGKMQDLPWCGFDVNGDLIVGWRDRRNAPGTGYQQAAEIWGAVKRKDSTSFSPNFRISDTIAPFNAQYLDTNGNDFMCIDLRNDTMYAVWGDVRTGALNVWFSRRGMGGTALTDIRLLTDDAVSAVSIYPNPVGTMLYFQGSKVSDIIISDLEGRILLNTKVKEQSADISFLSKGLYNIQLNTANGSATQRFLKD